MFRVNIRLYESVNQTVWRLVSGHIHDRSSLPNIDIGLHEGHCFYIKNLDVLVNHWECVGCQQRFTCHDNYERHVTERRCTGGQPKLVCDGGIFEHIMNSSEKVFFEGNTQFSLKACKWIECHSEQIERHIHHAFCGHGGKGVVINRKEILVDGYDSKTSTIYQFHGCKWHCCPCILGSTSDKYQKTLNLENQI